MEYARRLNLKERLRSISSIDTSRNYFTKNEEVYNDKSYLRIEKKK